MNALIVQLREVIEEAKSGFASGDNLESGLVQVRMNNISAEGKLDWTRVRRVSENQRNLDRLIVQPGDVLFNATNSPELVGKSAYFDGYSEPVTFSNHFLRLRPDVRKLDSKYLGHWLKRQFSLGVFRGLCKQWVNQATVSRDALLSMSMPLPALEEQRRIAAILDKAEGLRANRRTALALLDQLPQAIFLEMFGDPVSNPKQWPLERLSTLGKLDRGVSKHRPRNAPELLGGDHPLIQTGDVSNSDGFIRSYTATYSDVGLKQSKKWPKGTLCITIAANIAKTGILTFEACFPDSVVGFAAHNKEATQFVRVWLSFLQKTLEESAPESAQKNINLEILRNLPIPVPPFDMQEEFAARIEAIFSVKATHRSGHDKADAFFASLQATAFSGDHFRSKELSHV